MDVKEILAAIEGLSEADRRELFDVLVMNEELAQRFVIGDVQPLVAVVGECPGCGVYTGVHACPGRVEEPEVHLMLLSMPMPAEAGEPASGFIPAIRELRNQFELGLPEAVAIAKGAMPREMAVGPRELLEGKAEALRQWGCEVSLVVQHQ